MIFVLGETFLDSFKYYDSTRNDPAYDNAPVCTLALDTNKIGDSFVYPYENVLVEEALGGAGNFVNQLINLISDKDIDRINFYTSSLKDYLDKFLIKKIKYNNIGNKQAIKERIYVNDIYKVRFDYNDRIDIDKKNIEDFFELLFKDLSRFSEENNLIVISNYHKGLLHDDLISDLIKFNNKNIVIIDTNTINESYSNCDVLKINKKTAGDFCGWSMSVDNFSKHISEKLNIKDVIVTLGEEGYSHYNAENKVKNINKRKGNKLLIDTSGAGDSFFAGLVYGFIEGENMHNSLKIADKLAFESVQRRNTSHYVGKNKL